MEGQSNTEQFLGLVLQAINYISSRFLGYILGGMFGAVILRLRTNMNFKQFLGAIIISVFVSTSTGIVCKDYFEIKQDNVIFVLCGISGAFSKIILDELEEIIKYAGDIIKIKLMGKVNKDEETKDI